LAIDTTTVALAAVEGPFMLAGVIGVWKVRTLRSDTYSRLADPALERVTAIERSAFEGLANLQEVLNRELDSDERKNPERFESVVVVYLEAVTGKKRLQRRFNWALRSCSCLFYSLSAALALGALLIVHQFKLLVLAGVAWFSGALIACIAFVILSFVCMYACESRMKLSLGSLPEPEGG
jgi:hypothetical protein